jgi:hypothetical protein
VRAPRDGQDWMRYNPRQDEQRWSILNSTIAVLAASKNQPECMMLEQFESLVQPTQFLEFICKTVPLSDANLDMVTSMHETMLRRLNALEVLYKGGQRAVDEFNNSTLTGMERKKANAISKAKKSFDPNGQKGPKQTRRGGGGGSGTASTSSSSGGQQGGQHFKGAAPSGNGVPCAKCKRFNHKTEDCRS